MAYSNSLAALADPTRRRVFERLRAGPKPVGQLARGLPVSRPAVSQHLKVLKEAGLVTDRAEGAARVYSIDPKGLAQLRRWLDQFWDEALAAFKAEAEATASGSEAVGQKKTAPGSEAVGQKKIPKKTEDQP
jgi:DNA-binding transcriptional ArsR family regulator